MLHLFDRATMAHVLTLNLDPRLHRLLTQRIAGLKTEYGDVTDCTEFLIIETRDTEAEIIRRIGFSPLVEPIDGRRYGSFGFHPFWDVLTDHGGWFEMVVTFGSSFAVVLFIEDIAGEPSDIVAMCRDCVAT